MENEFQKEGYKLIKGLIDPKEFYDHAHQLAKEQKLKKDSTSFYVYKDPKFEKLLIDLIPVVEEHAGCKVYKTYSCARHYYKDDVLRAHKDRAACEISFTICLGYKGERWPLGIMNKDEIPQSIVMDPGDAVMYKGMQMMHWREKNIYGDSSKLFLHYVEQNGPHAALRDDPRPKPKKGLTTFFSNLLRR